MIQLTPFEVFIIFSTLGSKINHLSIKKARDDEKATSRAQAELKHLDQQLHVVVEEVQKLAEQNAR